MVGHFPDAFREICGSLWSTDPSSNLGISPCSSLTVFIITWSRGASCYLCCFIFADAEIPFFNVKRAPHPTCKAVYSTLGWEIFFFFTTYKRKVLKMIKTIWLYPLSKTWGRNLDVFKYGFFLGSPARSREVDLMIIRGPFQLQVFCDSKYLEKYKQMQFLLSLPLGQAEKLENRDLHFPVRSRKKRNFSFIFSKFVSRQ